MAYKAKLKLQDALEKADEAGFTDYAEYAGIYENPDATAEETEKAVGKLSQPSLISNIMLPRRRIRWM